MADGFKILAQAVLLSSDPATVPLADSAGCLIYQVPDASAARFNSRDYSQAVISSIVVCHVDSAAATHPYTIRVVKSGAGFDNKQYVIYNKDLSASDTDVLSLGIGLVSGDAIYAESYKNASSVSDLSISIFGTEVV
jgi:hypothetical protein